MNLRHLTPQELDIAYFIFDFLKDKDINMDFYPRNIHRKYRSQIKKLWPENESIPQTTASVLDSLTRKNELIHMYTYTPYKLNKNGCLYKLLTLHQRHSSVSG